jgi:hypothetical protein
VCVAFFNAKACLLTRPYRQCNLAMHVDASILSSTLSGSRHVETAFFQATQKGMDVHLPPAELGSCVANVVSSTRLLSCCLAYYLWTDCGAGPARLLVRDSSVNEWEIHTSIATTGGGILGREEWIAPF